MKKKNIIILKYKMMELIPKNNIGDEPNWEAMRPLEEGEEIDDERKQIITMRYDSKWVWIKKTFDKNSVTSIEKTKGGSILINKEGTFIIKKSFKKLFKLIYK